MQIPILNGIYIDNNADYRSSYPRNMMPVPKAQGISAGYLRPAEGIIAYPVQLPGIDRGGINWQNTCYRVAGTKLISIYNNGAINVLGTVGGSGQVRFTYSFDRLAIASDKKLFYWNGTSLTQVTDSDLGSVLDVVWVDGYFMTTDGDNLVVTELNNPLAVDPFKYGSSEADPDPIVSLLKLRNEIYAINRYTIEIFQNVGGEGFPFARVDGAQIQRGALGTFTAVVFLEGIAFLGSGKNEAPAVWVGSNGMSNKISTREIDQVLLNYTEAELANSVLEVRLTSGHWLLYIHLKNQTLVYDATATQIMQEPVWFTLTSSISGLGQYRAKNFIWCYDKWLCADPTSTTHGYLTTSVSSHYGNKNGWDFSTLLLFNEGKGALFNELELIAVAGNIELGINPTIWTSYSVEGKTWSQERPRLAGKQGDYLRRIVWFQQGLMKNFRIQKFRGTSDAHLSFSRLEANVDPLYV